jgi:hypothetical protein
VPRPTFIPPEPPFPAERIPHEIDLDGMAAGSYFRIGRHWFMAMSVNLTTRASIPRSPADDPMRDMDEIDMRLVHAGWKGCGCRE